MTEPTHITAKTGARLRARRNALELSLADVAGLTNIGEDHIRAIEAMDAEGLPSIGYALGFVRSYAKALGLQPDAWVADYKRDAAAPENLRLRDAPHFVWQRRIRLPRGFMAAVSVVGFATMMGLWYGLQTGVTANESAGVILPLAEDDSETPTAPILDDGLLTLRMTAPSWVRVTTTDGVSIVSRIFVTGETWQGSTRAQYRVSVRDAGAVELYDGTRLIGPLGARGEALEDILLTP